jgi:hypothetical protein
MTVMRKACVATMVIVALAVGLASPASAQERPNGPTASDFTNGSEFDTEGYLAAFVEFQSAPSVARGSDVQLNVFQCPAGSTVTAVFLGAPETEVTATAPDSADEAAVLVIHIPDDAEIGFNRIRVTCGDLLKDVVINVVGAGSADAVDEIDVYMIAPPEGTGVVPTDGGVAAAGGTAAPGTLPVTGSNVRNLVGGGFALLLMGGALAVGVRQRLRTTA